MVISSPLFILLYLPVVLIGYWLVGSRFRNAYLLLTSIFFYAWGEMHYVLILLFSIILNYFLGILVDRYRKPEVSRLIIAATVIINIGVLICLKYAVIHMVLLQTLLRIFHLPPETIQTVHLPIGLSFFTFQAIAYVVDVGREESKVQRSLINFGMFMALFPKLTAGPIIRYQEVENNFDDRSISLDDFAYGIKRFITGLGKKVLIANTLARTTDQIFAIPSHDLTTGLAWLGIVCFTLQIYFDFSGYSDMAIGLGRMFGFRFMENFNYPYISRSLTEFWRRWHISLSSWFRDYLFIPLVYALMTDSIRARIAQGKYKIPYRTLFSIFTVFTLCGVWHGATLNFLVWGMFHGIILVCESLKISTLLKKAWAPIAHIYTLTLVMMSWVFFKIASFSEALSFIRTLCGGAKGVGVRYHAGMFLDLELLLVIVFGCIFSLPLAQMIKRYVRTGDDTKSTAGFVPYLAPAMEMTGVVLVLLLSLVSLAGSSYNPFIYGKF